MPSSSSLRGQKMLQLWPPVWLFVIVAAYMKTGTIRRAEAAQAVNDTHLAMTGVRNLGLEMGWHTAMYRSADITVRKMLDVNWLIDVVVR